MECLVTELKSVVGNDSLPVLGWIRLYIQPVTNPSNKTNGLQPGMGMGRDGVIKTTGNTFFATWTDNALVSTGHKEQTFSMYSYIYFTNDKGSLLLSDQTVSIQSLSGATSVEKAYYVNLDEFEYVSKLEILAIRRSINSSGDFIHLARCVNLTNVSIGETNIECDISKFAIRQIDEFGRTTGTLAIANVSRKTKINNEYSVDNGDGCTVNYLSSTSFTITNKTIGTLTYTKSGGIWSYTLSNA